MAIPSEKKLTLSSLMKTFHPNQPQLLSPKKFGNFMETSTPTKNSAFYLENLHSALLVRNTLILKGINCSDTCPFCQEDRNILDHLFFNAPSLKLSG